MRSTDYALLHPTFRQILQDLDAALEAEQIPLMTFEGWRDPQRQLTLWEEGRVPGIGTPGHFVTKAEPWVSYHQYGLGVDKVFWLNGQWTWKEPEQGMWDQYHKLALDRNLMPLVFEQPHVQLAGIKLNDLLAGKYPPGGDDSWENNLDQAIIAWGRTPKVVNGQTFRGAPPLVGQRPVLLG